jgi:hypothetical protein
MVWTKKKKEIVMKALANVFIKIRYHKNDGAFAGQNREIHIQL